MARPLRHPIVGGWYHVFGRGWERRRIFADDVDRKHFLELLGDIGKKYCIEVHAYALMDNHHHLILRTPEANLSAGMQWFNTSYSAWYNARHNRVGSLWQGRYRDVLIENSAWAYELSVYIHLNPLRMSGFGLDKRGRVLESRGYRVPTPEAVTERLKKLRSYLWSSYRAYAGYAKPEEWLAREELLGRSDNDPDKQVRSYREHVRERLKYGVDTQQAERLRDLIALGSYEFSRKIRQVAGAGDPEVTHRQELRKLVDEGRIRKVVEEIQGMVLSEFSSTRGDWGRPLYLWAVRTYCGLTLREAGAPFGGMKPSAVAMAVRRWEQCMKDDERAADQGRKLQARLQSV